MALITSHHTATNLLYPHAYRNGLERPKKSQVSSAHAVEREFRVLRALWQNTDVPVPQALLLCEDSSIIGTPFYIMEFMVGRVFSDSSLPGMGGPVERAAAYASAAETLARIHRVDFRAVGLADYGHNRGGYFVRQVETLAKVAKKQVGDICMLYRHRR